MGNEDQYKDVVDEKRLLSELSHKQNRIDSLLEITEAINRNFTVEELFTIYTYSLKAQFKYNNVFIMYKKAEDWYFMHDNEEDVLEDTSVLEVLKPFTSLSYLEETEAVLGEYDVVVPVIHKDEPLAYVLIEGVHNAVVGSLDEEIRFLQTITNVTVTAAENKRLFRETLEKELEEKDMRLATDIQSALLPQEFPEYEGCKFGAVYIPHSAIGGDYYDVIPHPHENSFYLAVADVSGKGVSAALLMASFQATLRSAISTDLDFETFARHINSESYRITKGDKFVTLFAAKIDLENRKIQYLNAGHNPPVLKSNGTLHKLTKGTVLLGAFPELPFVEMGEESLGENTTIFIYTDGLTDLINNEDERFRLEGLMSFMNKNNFSDPNELNNVLMKRLEDYKGRNRFNDDITFLTTIVN